MDKKKLLINLPQGYFEHKMLQSRFASLEKEYDVKKTSCNTHEEIRPFLSWAEAILMWSWPAITAEDFEIATNLKFLGQINTTITTAEPALKKGIVLSEARHCWSPAVSEMALTLILNGLRKVSQFHIEMRQGVESWVDAFPTDINPLERQLTGRKVGIIGFGRIGQGLADLLSPFKVQLQIFDPFLPESVVKGYGAQMSSVDEISRSCEVIVLCAANAETASKTFNAGHISSMLPNAVLVNVGRSMLVDMDALLVRLKKGDITAMLDVFDTEPLEADSPFRVLSNAYLSPHRAGGIMESVLRAFDMLTEDMELYFAGEKLKYSVNESMLSCFSK